MTAIYHSPGPVKFRRFKLHTHLIADTHEELEAVARRLGLKPQWIQDAGTPKEHYDVFDGVIDRLPLAGAKEVSRNEWVWMIQRKRAKT